MIALAGCGKGPGTGSKSSTKSTSPLPVGSVEMGAGSMSHRREPGSILEYTLRWQHGVVQATDPIKLGAVGDMKGVSGILYKGGKPAADFSADEGTADNTKGVLVLKGNVRVKSVGGNKLLEGTLMTCDRVTYASGDEIIKASGGVNVQNKGFTIGPIAEAWCSNTLSEVASPRRLRSASP